MDWFNRALSTLKHGGEVPPLDRFTDQNGADRQLAVIMRNPAVCGNENLAATLIHAGEVVSFKKGEDIIIEGDVEDDSVFFILSGVADVFVNGKRRDDIQRVAPGSIGEMSALDPAKPRSASVRAASKQLVALKVPGAVIRNLTNENGEFLQLMRADIAERGRQAIKATGLSRRPSGWGWTAIALTAGFVSGCAARYVIGGGGGSGIVSFVVPFVVGVVAFILVLLVDPVYRFFRLGSFCVGAIVVNEALKFQLRGSVMGVEFDYQMSSSGEAVAATTFATPVVLGALAAFLFWLDSRRT